MFSAFLSVIIFVICRSAKKNFHGEVHEENAEANICPFLNLSNVLKWEIKCSFDRNFIIFWQIELVCFFCFLFGTSSLF